MLLQEIPSCLFESEDMMSYIGFPEGSYDKGTRQLVGEEARGLYTELRAINDTIALSDVRRWRQAFDSEKLKDLQLWKVRCSSKSYFMKPSVGPNRFVLQFRVFMLMIYALRKQTLEAAWPEAWLAFENIVGSK